MKIFMKIRKKTENNTKTPQPPPHKKPKPENQKNPIKQPKQNPQFL